MKSSESSKEEEEYEKERDVNTKDSERDIELTDIMLYDVSSATNCDY